MQPPPDDPALQARLLAAGLGFDDDIPVGEAIPAEVIDLARDGEVIPAIRRLRKLRGLGLLQAKRVVDAIGAQDGSGGSDLEPPRGGLVEAFRARRRTPD